MKRHILIFGLLAGLAVSGRAGDTNPPAAVSTNPPAGSSTNAAAIAAAAGTAGNAPTNNLTATNPPVWESSISAGLSLMKGNSDTLLTTAAFKTRKKTPFSEFMFSTEGSYGKNNSVENNEMLHGVGQYNHLFNERFYGFLNLEGLHDGIANLQYRFTISPGAGYYFAKTASTTFAVETGPGMIFQRLGGADTSYESLRLADRFERKLDNGARLWQKAEILPQVDKFANYLVNAEIGAEALLTKTVSLRLMVQDNFVNEPAPGRKDNDVKIISGLVYKF